ncbi:MAG: hypothetical protein ACOYL3_29345 [Desulfuromonadaceae bacterium]
MNINSIADGMSSFKAPFIKSANQIKQPVKDTAGMVAPSKIQEDPSKVFDAVNAPTPKNTVREMSRVSESYDARGNVITKYTDSRSNVIYQTPSEAVLRTQELMSKTQATNIKV